MVSVLAPYLTHAEFTALVELGVQTMAEAKRLMRAEAKRLMRESEKRGIH